MNNLFGEGQNPVGATIRVKNFPMKVIGVLTVKGQSSYGQDQDDVVIVPFNTAERKVLGVSAPTAQSSPAAVATASTSNCDHLRLLRRCRPPTRFTARAPKPPARLAARRKSPAW